MIKNQRMFSQNNSNFSSIDIDFMGHPVFLKQEELAENYPYQLTRQTNEWMFYYGLYPTHCALIATEEKIMWRRRMGERHVVGIKIDQTEDRLMRRDVMRKIGDLVAQLDKFSAEGLVWEKNSGCINVIFQGRMVVLKMYVCDDSGMFHIVAEGTMNQLNKLLYSIRVMYQENDPLPSFESIELTQEKWEATYTVTREKMEHITFQIRVDIMDDPEEPPIKKRRIE